MSAHLEPGLGLAVGAVLGVLVAFLIPPGLGSSVRLGVALDATLLCALIHPWLIILTSTAEQTRQRAAVDFPGRTTLGLIKLFVRIAGLVAAVWFVRPAPPGTSTTHTAVELVLGIVAIASSWLLLHTAYTMRYAHQYYYAGAAVNADAAVDAGAQPSAEAGAYNQTGGLAFANAAP